MKLTFPKFEDIKNLPINEAYKFNLFNFHNGYCRIIWNEEGYKKLDLDIMKNGYLEEYYTYERTEENYIKLQEKANSIYNEMVEELLNPTNEWDIDKCYICRYEDDDII